MAQIQAVDYQQAIQEMRVSVGLASMHGDLFGPEYVSQLFDVLEKHASVNAIFREARTHRPLVSGS